MELEQAKKRVEELIPLLKYYTQMYFDDKQVVIATNQGEPVVGEGSQAGAAYDRVCRRLTGEEIPVYDFSQPEGLFGKISGFFHRNQGGTL